MSNGNHELLVEVCLHGFMGGDIVATSGMKREDAQLVTVHELVCLRQTSHGGDCIWLVDLGEWNPQALRNTCF
jgi:hypothetical protein